MTIGSSTARVTYNCDGTTTVFPIPMQAYLATDFLVLLINAQEVATVLTLGGGYTLASSGSLSPTDWVLTALPSAYPGGYTLEVILNLPLVQQTQYVQGQAFPSAAIQANLDRLTQMDIRQQDWITRSIRAPDGDVLPTMLLPPAAIRAGNFLSFDVNGNLSTGTLLPVGGTISRAIIGAFLYPIQGGEVAVMDTSYPYLDPRRYGAVGDGVTDDTFALSSWVASVNAGTNPVATWPVGSVFLCGPLPIITVNMLTWNCGSTLLQLPNSGPGNHLTVTGSNASIRDLTMLGNQFAMASSGVGTNGLIMSGTGFQLEDVSVSGYAGSGVICDTVTKGAFINCHFDSNAQWGGVFQTASYMTFVATTFDFNGYGFQLTFATNGFIAFGIAIRLRSHHFTFTACRAIQNGRDGMNVNQGSYAIKFSQCLCWMNDDGGFTIASDNTGTGRPGEGEACYDLQYVECESYNNWGSGMPIFTTAYNVKVIGGSYYNNGRGSGIAPATPSPQTTSGIYVNTNSLGVDLQTACYDDRQIRKITAQASGVVTATGWVAGTFGNYPRVAFYNAAYVFQGYATITAESAGSVTVSISGVTMSPVTVASIVSGWFVSQRMQHNGAYFDLGVTGEADIDGFGQLTGPSGFVTGYKVYSAPGSNQNVRNLTASPPSIELLSSPSWDSGTGAGSTWNYAVGSGGAQAGFSTAGTSLHSPAALLLTGGTSAVSTGNSVLISGGTNYVQDVWFEASCMVTATDPGDAQISVAWDTSTSLVWHPGGGTKCLQICGYLPAGNVALILQVLASATKAVVFDEASVKVRRQPFDIRDFAYPSRNLAV